LLDASGLCFIQVEDFKGAHFVVETDSLRDSNSFFMEKRSLGGLVRRQEEMSHLTRYERFTGISDFASFRVSYEADRFVDSDVIFTPGPEFYPASFVFNHGLDLELLGNALIEASG